MGLGKITPEDKKKLFETSLRAQEEWGLDEQERIVTQYSEGVFGLGVAENTNTEELRNHVVERVNRWLTIKLKEMAPKIKTARDVVQAYEAAKKGACSDLSELLKAPAYALAAETVTAGWFASSIAQGLEVTERIIDGYHKMTKKINTEPGTYGIPLELDALFTTDKLTWLDKYGYILEAVWNFAKTFIPHYDEIVAGAKLVSAICKDSIVSKGINALLEVAQEKD